MRTNIVIDDSLMSTALELSGLKTKKNIIDQALRLYVQMLHQKELLKLRGKLKWEGNLDEMRTNL